MTGTCGQIRKPHSWGALVAFGMIAGGGMPAAPAQTCDYGWSERLAAWTYGSPPVPLGVVDLGQGPTLLAGVETLGGAADRLAVLRWTGRGWAELGARFDGYVRSLASVENAAGRSIYLSGSHSRVGGHPATAIVRWNGVAWASLPAPPPFRPSLLVAHDDGAGEALFAFGGETDRIDIDSTLFRWDGAAWTRLGAPWEGDVSAVASFWDEAGPAIYAVGRPVAPWPRPAFMARWDRFGWSLVGGEISVANGPYVSALAVFDAGAGPALYVAGAFDRAGGVAATGVARWDGAQWSPLGAGITGNVWRLTVFDAGAGPQLYAYGDGLQSAGTGRWGILRWDGERWQALGNGLGARVKGAGPARTANGPTLIIGGHLTQSSDPEPVVSQSYIGWDGEQYVRLNRALTGRVTAFGEFDFGSGTELVVSGTFTYAGDERARYLARWDGWRWRAGPALPAPADAICVFDDGRGAALYCASNERRTGGVVIGRVLRWDGAAWEQLGGEFDDELSALAVFDSDDGAGPRLFVGGRFRQHAGAPLALLARWDGSRWEPLAGGFGDNAAGSVVSTLCTHDDGTGAALYAGGAFTTVSGQPIGYVARWRGRVWSPVGGVLDSPVHALIEHAEDGGPPKLFAGGAFTVALSGGQHIFRLARWDGGAWAPVSGVNGPVRRLASMEENGQRLLYLSGEFSSGAGWSLPGLARWDGDQLTPTPTSPVTWPHLLASFDDDGAGPRPAALYVAARDGSSATLPALTRYGCLENEYIPGDANCDGRVSVFDVDAFVLALVDPPAHHADYPDCSRRTADVNRDGDLNVFDIDAFVARLVGGP